MRGGRVVTSSLNWLAMRSSTERRCSSPNPHNTVSLSTASWATRQRRILRGDPVQHVRNALLVAAPLGLDRHAVHRRREFERLHVDVVFVVRIVQHAIELDFVHLGHRGNVAGHRAVDLDVLASLQHEQVPDLERLARHRRRRAAYRASIVPWCTRKMPSLPTNGSITTLNTCASTCLRGIGLGMETRSPPRPRPW